MCISLTPCGIESLPGRLNSCIDINLRSCHSSPDDFLSTRVKHIKRFASFGVNEFSIDEELVLDCLQFLGELGHDMIRLSF